MALIVIRCFCLEARALPATGSKVAGGADTRPLRRPLCRSTAVSRRPRVLYRRLEPSATMSLTLPWSKLSESKRTVYLPRASADTGLE
jgi:hypothetical protein